MKFIYAIPLLLLFAPYPALADTLPHNAASSGVPGFIDEMVAKHKFKRAELESVFSRAQHLQSVIDAISRPATIKPWPEYRAAFVNTQRVKLGVEFWHKYRLTLRRAEKTYGVPQEIILAVIGVETIYGQDAGTYRIIDALTTLAFDYPQRADYFRSELENFLILAREQQYDLLSINGSYAGAIGIPQFMPSSYRNYALDFNGNHKIDLLNEPGDAIGSVANYLKGYGWKKGEPVAVQAQVSGEICAGETVTPRSLDDWKAVGISPEKKLAHRYLPYRNQSARLIDFTVLEGKEFWLAFSNFDVITRYNNSDFYAMTVLQLAEELKAARKSGSAYKPK